MANVDLQFNYPTSSAPGGSYTVNGYVDNNETYRTQVVAEGVCHAKNTYNDRTFDSTITSVSVQYPNRRFCFYVYT